VLGRIAIAIRWLLYPPTIGSCNDCRFFVSKESAIKSEPVPGYYRRDLKYSGFCKHPHKSSEQVHCAWVDYGCLFKEVTHEQRINPKADTSQDR
jgi:hypothetical protein